MVATGALNVSNVVGEAEWDAFVAGQPGASGYHLWRWRHVFERGMRHETHYLVARRDRRIAGILPLVVIRSVLFGRFMVSLPFVNYGGVLAREPEAARNLVDAAVRLAQARRLAYVELRHRDRQFPALQVRQHKVGMWMRLAEDASEMWNRFDRKVRNQIRKAEKSNLQTISGGVALLDDFYSVFARNMRDLGTPVYSRDFFAEMLRQFADRARVWLVRHESRTVAGALTFAHGDTIEVPSASCLQSYRALCPNHLLYWAVIQEAIAGGFRCLDFGRSTPNEGTFHFKQQWGAEPQPLFWEYHLVSGRALPDRSPGNPRFKPAIALWKRLPVPVATLLGPHVVRGIP